jgi:hypothetical protein
VEQVGYRPPVWPQRGEPGVHNALQRLTERVERFLSADEVEGPNHQNRLLVRQAAARKRFHSLP